MKPRYWIIVGSCIVVAVACAVVVMTAAPADASPPVVLDAAVTHVPAGQYMVVDTYDKFGQLTAHFIVDPASKRALQKRPFEESVGDDITIYDINAHSTFIALGPEVVESTAGYECIDALIDSLAGMEAKPIGEGTVEGRTTTRVVVDLQGDVRGTVSVDIDPETGLRIREEWSSGSDRKTLVRGLVPATSLLAAQLERGSLEELVETTLDERMQTMVNLSYEVLALKPGSSNLRLLFVTPGPSWDWVSLTYESPDNPGLPALVIETWNLAARPDYPETLLLPLSQAVAETNEAGDRLCYGLGNTGIQLAAYAGRFPGSVTDVAANLVDARFLVQADR